MMRARKAVAWAGGVVLAFMAWLATLLTALVSPATSAGDPAPVVVPEPAWDFDTARLASDHGCSSTGLGEDVIPGGALVHHDGATVHTSFDEGWAVYESGVGGVLLAVCES